MKVRKQSNREGASKETEKWSERRKSSSSSSTPTASTTVLQRLQKLLKSVESYRENPRKTTNTQLNTLCVFKRNKLFFPVLEEGKAAF